MAKNNSDNNKENKKSLIKKILAAFVAIDIIVGVVFLICYFKGCGPFNKNTSSSISSAIDTTDYQKVDSNLKHIVEHQMELDGFEDDPIQAVVAVTYVLRDGNTGFNLMISAISPSYLYNLKVEGVQYKEGTDTLVSYLLCNNEIEGATNLYREQITGEHLIIPNGRYITSVPISGAEEHKTGYELIDNNFHVTQIVGYQNDGNTVISGMHTVIIEESQPLYNYYRYLLDR